MIGHGFESAVTIIWALRGALPRWGADAQVDSVQGRLRPYTYNCRDQVHRAPGTYNHIQVAFTLGIPRFPCGYASGFMSPLSYVVNDRAELPSDHIQPLGTRRGARRKVGVNITHDNHRFMRHVLNGTEDLACNFLFRESSPSLWGYIHGP